MSVYVNKDDYFEFSGINLDIELRKSNSDNPSKAVDIFITRIENWCMDYLKRNYWFDDEEFNPARFKQGVLHQIDYVRAQGDLSLTAVGPHMALAPNALVQFQLGGMANCTRPRAESVFSKYGY